MLFHAKVTLMCWGFPQAMLSFMVSHMSVLWTVLALLLQATPMIHVFFQAMFHFFLLLTEKFAVPRL